MLMVQCLLEREILSRKRTRRKDGHGTSERRYSRERLDNAADTTVLTSIDGSHCQCYGYCEEKFSFIKNLLSVKAKDIKLAYADYII